MAFGDLAIAIVSFAILLIIGAALPFIQKDFGGATTTNSNPLLIDGDLTTTDFLLTMGGVVFTSFGILIPWWLEIILFIYKAIIALFVIRTIRGV